VPPVVPSLPEAPCLQAASVGACCILPSRIRDGGGDPWVAAARVGLGEGEPTSAAEGGRCRRRSGDVEEVRRRQRRGGGIAMGAAS
jgi:hypothetical protein